MRKIYISLSITAVTLLFFNFFSLNFHMRSSGSPGGNTGAPGQFNGRTCANSSCHSGNAILQLNMITSDIPASGYKPGETYTITGTVSEPGITKFGFEISPQDSAGNLLGSLTVTNSTETQLTNQSKSVTHTFAGNSGPSGTKSWSFDWTAPSAGTGLVTFWGAFNAANSNNSTSGDIIYRSLLAVDEDTTTTVNIDEEIASSIFMFPNPVSETLYISLKNPAQSRLQVEIHNLSGKKMESAVMAKNASRMSMDVRDFPAGNYLLTLKNSQNGILLQKRLMKF